MLVVQHPTSFVHPFSKSHLDSFFPSSSIFLIPQLGDDSELTHGLCSSKCTKNQSQDLQGKDKYSTSSKNESNNTSGVQESLIYSDHKTKAYETESSYRFVIDLPGVKESDVDLEVEGNSLRLKAERKSQGKDSAPGTILRSYNESYRIRRAHWDASDVTSVMQDGVLTVTIQKTEAMKPFRVQINAHEPETNLLDENKSGLWLTLDVPGVKAADASVEFKNGFLHVQYKRHSKEVSRTFAVDESSVNLSNVRAFLADGVLTITAPSRPSKRVKLTSESTKKISAQETTETDTTNDETKNNVEDVQDAKEYDIVPQMANTE